MLRIAEARQSRGWSQEQLAAAIGTTQQTIQRWETGQIDPKIGRVLEISRVLGVTVSDVLGVDSSSEEPALTPDELELLSCYRSSDNRGRRNILTIARAEAGMGGQSQVSMSA